LPRRDQERLRLAVARALLNAARPLVLADNPLLDEPAVARLARERYAEMALGAELALGDLVRQAGELVLARLGEDSRLGRERAVLRTVLGGGSASRGSTSQTRPGGRPPAGCWRRSGRSARGRGRSGAAGGGGWAPCPEAQAPGGLRSPSVTRPK
jgi:hypothetical protein